MVRFWSWKALSSEGTFYVPSTLSVLSVMAPYTEADFPKVIRNGAFWGGVGLNVGYALSITDDNNLVDYTNVAVKFVTPSSVKEVYIQGQLLSGLYGYITDEDTLGNTVKLESTHLCSGNQNQGFTDSNTLACP